MNWFKWFLFPLSALFFIITSIRNCFYNIGWIKSAEFDIPIIGIGNITVGGTGKTPHTAYIANLLTKKNVLGVLSKGYGRKTKEFRYVETNSIVKEVGDEPLQTKLNFPNQIIAVDHQRVNGVLRMLNDNPKINSILLDDAFQHRSIDIGLNILLTDYNRLIYKDYLMPIGNLRESKKGIHRADNIIVTKCPNNLNIKEANKIEKSLKFNGDIFFSKIVYGELVSLTNNKNTIDYKDFNKVLLVTAIAQNTSIVKHLESKNVECQEITFRDHYNYNEKDVEKIIKTKKKMGVNSIILTTEKDAQKLNKFQHFKNSDVYYLKVSIDFLWNKDKFDKKIMDYVRNNQTDNNFS
jgi:tetraacyldisaccharide 4'-kinase